MLSAHDIIGLPLHDRDGVPAGRITAFYRYPQELNAPWGIAAVTRRSMLVFTTTHLVDLHGAQQDGGHVAAAYPLELISKVPDRQPMIGNVLGDNDAAENSGPLQPAPLAWRRRRRCYTGGTAPAHASTRHAR